jgi:chemotaxis receptor (MCP) glutamine deamidase CheD
VSVIALVSGLEWLSVCVCVCVCDRESEEGVVQFVALPFTQSSACISLHSLKFCLFLQEFLPSVFIQTPTVCVLPLPRQCNVVE